MPSYLMTVYMLTSEDAAVRMYVQDAEGNLSISLLYKRDSYSGPRDTEKPSGSHCFLSSRLPINSQEEVSNHSSRLGHLPHVGHFPPFFLRL